MLPQLRWLCVRERLNEQAHAWLMTALAAAGQQAAALHVFTELRSLLDRELGVAPSPVLIEARPWCWGSGLARDPDHGAGAARSRAWPGAEGPQARPAHPVSR